MRRHLLALAVLCGLTFFAGLGRAAIADTDEAFYAEAAREMLETGDWITPRYNYEFRFQKPILYYWLAAASYLTAGVGAAAARFPSALSGLALVFVTYFCARRWYEPATGFLAGAIVATSFGYFFMARQALPDLPLAFFITLATWLAMAALSNEAIDRGRDGSTSKPFPRRRWLVAASAATAAAFLTKGPVGIALPALVVLPIVAWERRSSAASGARWPRRLCASDVAAAALVFALLATPWYGAMVRVHGVEYLHQFFVGENLERFATDRFNEPRPFWFYLPIVAGGMLPWSPLMLVWIPSIAGTILRRRPVTPVETRLLVWAIAPLIFYSVSVGKQPRYVLPILPPLAILLAASIRARLGAGRRPSAESSDDAWLAAGGALAGLVLMLAGALAFHAAPVLDVVNAGSTLWAAIIVALCGAATIGASLSRQRRHLPTMMIGVATVTLLAVQYAVLSAAGPEAVETMAGQVRNVYRTGDQSGTYRVFVRNLVFYTHIKQVDLVNEEQAAGFLKSQGRVLCVTPENTLEAIARIAAAGGRRVGAVTYVNTANLKLGTLLSPNPALDVERVVLVVNRE